MNDIKGSVTTKAGDASYTIEASVVEDLKKRGIDIEQEVIDAIVKASENIAEENN